MDAAPADNVAPAKGAASPTRAEPPPPLGGGAPPSREALLAAPIRSYPRPSALDAPMRSIKGVGPKLAAGAEELGIETIADLLWHLPRDYRDRAAPIGIGDLRLGEEATVEVEVRSARLRPTRRRGLTILEAKVFDASGSATATWFNRAWLADRLAPGTRLLLRGKLERRGFNVAEHELVGTGGDDRPEGLHTTGVVPIHPATEGLRPQKLREWIWGAIGMAPHALEALPAAIRSAESYPGAADALVAAHFPRDLDAAKAARRRHVFEELFLHQAALASRRGRRRRAGRAPELPAPGEGAAGWLASLPFELTGAQRQAISELDADLSGRAPMQRLLMGEVGSGKTVVALYAMLRAVEAGHQAALMAPTETLAEQHLATIERLLPDSPAPMALLTGSAPAAARERAAKALRSGQPMLAVGTHALIEPSIEFASLAVAVVDEQHRFGVRQRSELDAKGPGGLIPHVLHMTATPIPRTLSLTAYGDLDVSVLAELPAGRKPVGTWVVGEEKRAGAYEFIRERLREGRQAYVVCPLVADSAERQARAAEAEAERLGAGELAQFTVELLHGRLGAERKARAMSRFASGEADVLVATTVIEVGIDVPNASVMLIEGAERFGLSQLHQLRGRVGRGPHDSHCILFADPESDTARARLDAIARETDGFKLAETDLVIRGEGELLGTRQHGLPRFRAARLPEDTGVLVEARARVRELLDRHGSLESPELGPLLDEARRRFGDERSEQIAA